MVAENRIAYWHVTEPENLPSILRDGLSGGDENMIWVVDRRDVASAVALNQTFTPEFALIGVRRDGITGEVEPDDVAEYTRHHQWIVRQSRIARDHLYYAGTYLAWYPPLPEGLASRDLRFCSSYRDPSTGVLRWRLPSMVLLTRSLSGSCRTGVVVAEAARCGFGPKGSKPLAQCQECGRLGASADLAGWPGVDRERIESTGLPWVGGGCSTCADFRP